MDAPRLSIVVPGYVDAGSLRRLLADLTAQDVDPEVREVIVVDDGSSEPLGPQIAEALQRLGRAQCVRKANGGGPSARNHGAGLARGTLVMFLDQDLRIPPDFVRAHLDAHDIVGQGAVCARYENRLLDDAGSFSRWYASMAREWEGAGRTATREVAPGLVEIHPVLLTSTNLSLPRTIFEAIGGLPIYRQTGVEDQAFGLLAQRRGLRVFRTDRVCAQHVETRAELYRFCHRQRIGMAATTQLIHEFPDVFGPLEATTQHRVNGPIRLGIDGPGTIVRKALKSLLVHPGGREAVDWMIKLLGAVTPGGRLVDPLYRLVIGAHLQRGWRDGLAEAGKS